MASLVRAVIAMDLMLLKTFLKVAAVGNITKAAALLFVTQSAVSRRIKQLEEQVGKPLLDRTGTSLVLTDTGRLLLEKGRKILEIENEFFSSINLCRDKKKISFCCTTSLGIDHLSGVLSTLIADNSTAIDLNCVFAMPEEALAGIDSGRFDIALIVQCDEIDLKDRITHPLPDDEVVFLSAPSLGISADENTIDRFFSERLYLFNEKGCAKRFLDKNLRSLGRNCSEFASVVYFNDFSFILREVLANKGITFLSSSFVKEELERGRLRTHHVTGFNHVRPRSLILGSREIPPHLETFIDCLFTAYGFPRLVPLPE